MDLNTWFTRYRPYLAILAAITALIAFLPGDGADTELASTDGGPAGDFDFDGAPSTSVADDGTIIELDETGAPVSTGGPARTQQQQNAGPAGGPTQAPTGPLPTSETAATSPDCDPATGRIKFPTSFAPPCAAPFSGDNGGATYQGVTKDKIKVVYFMAEEDPAVSAALTAAGAQNQPPERIATMKDYVDMFNKHYETYGRQVELVVREGSGESDDDNAARADALRIATEDKAFAVIGSPASNAFVETLAAKGVLCICTVSQPQELYERLAPYVGYTTLMSSTQGYIHRAEYVGKRLARRKAVHAGTRDAIPMSTEDRKFGMLWYETPDNAYRSGAVFFEKELKEKYNVTLAESRSYPGTELAQVQERAQALIQAMKEAGVTSIIFSGDPITPAIFTREASKQRYFPEWIITGSALTDTAIFARTFDQTQWNKAFGISFLTARGPQEAGAAYKTHVWHHGRTPTANNQYGVIYPGPFTLFTGIHMAGPNLTVHSWQKGLFNYPVTGQGRKMASTVSWGNHGLWPFTDYTAYDDVTEIWWDPAAPGEDEVGNQGAGLYRYVDGGVRYLPGTHPTSDPKAFVTEGTSTIYQTPPPGEEEPDYPHEKH